VSDSENAGLLWLAIAWLAYAFLHSVLASLRVKSWIGRLAPTVMSCYRLIFNGIAVITALPIVWLLLNQLEGPYVLSWHGPWRWLALGLTLASCIGFLFSLRTYDLGEFIGLRQLRERSTDIHDHAGFSISFLHRFVRHPWYFFALVMLWTQNMNAAMLVNAVAISAYFAIGTFFEERKLMVSYGEAYRRYMTRVPGLIPLPWKFLSAAEAAQIASMPPGDS